ncbi:hypothetical protein CDL12_07286 [Handroanthus impetiginosus]|uniref:Uncharacterized protein n=1 Tax=Handroanthus impetiginosus TaxID=429701 RepID=A0A2G9HR79_9LAMI|nr:hypothetical protein CDL12_07286 [Handroanthus impetiginosus]
MNIIIVVLHCACLDFHIYVYWFINAIVTVLQSRLLITSPKGPGFMSVLLSRQYDVC